MKLFFRMCLMLLLSSMVLPVFAAGKTLHVKATDTPAWIDLSREWRDLTKHWTGDIYSNQKLKTLKEEITVSLAALPAADRDFTATLRSAVTDITRRRLAFITNERYESNGSINATDLEISEMTARTALENDLAVLVSPPLISEVPVETLKANARKDILLQVDLLQRSQEVKALISQRRAEAEKKEADKKQVDWNKFELASYRCIKEVIDSYNARKPRANKEIKRLHELVLSLIEEPLPTFGVPPPEPMD
jgi:hypothetical protein